MIFDLGNKTAILTGGYGHLGKSMALSLLQFNANVVVAGRSKDRFLQSFSENERDHIHFREMDIKDSSSIKKCIDSVLLDFGSIDILINNAISSQGQNPEELSDDDWASTMDGVLGSCYKTIRSVIPAMKSQKAGKIVNISSMYGIVSPDFDIYSEDNCEKYLNPPHYGVAKAGLNQLTRYFAAYLGKDNIQVNSISPGPFPNPSIQKENPVFIRRLENKNPSGRIGQPEDLAGALILLCSNASNYITGQVIQVDGGWTII